MNYCLPVMCVSMCVSIIMFSGCRPDESRQVEIERRASVLEQDLKTLYERVGSIQISVAEATKNLGNSADSKRVNALSSKIDDIDNRLRSIKSELDDLTQKTDRSDASTHAELGRVNTSMTDMQQRVKAFESVAQGLIKIAEENAKPACLAVQWDAVNARQVSCQCKGYCGDGCIVCFACNHTRDAHTRDKNGNSITR